MKPPRFDPRGDARERSPARPPKVPISSPGKPGYESVMLDITRERERQIAEEGWSPHHDDTHKSGEMARAAACYALQSTLGDPMRSFEAYIDGGTTTFKRKYFKVGTINISYLLWPWQGSWWKPTTARRDLVKAAALIVAEIERLDRLAPPSPLPTTEPGPSVVGKEG